MRGSRLALRGLCSVHRNGRTPGQPDYFTALCARCRELLAAGKRTGHEPTPPEDNHLRAGRRAQDAGYAAAMIRKAALAKPTPGPR